jgi:hypothetical protein
LRVQHRVHRAPLTTAAGLPIFVRRRGVGAMREQETRR